MSNPDFSKMTADQLRAYIADQQSQAQRPYFKAKVSEKGCLTIHCNGLRRFGATFYASEWRAILGNADKVKAALADNAEALASTGN